MFDLLIKNGTIFDGSGAEGFQGDLGISGEKIAAIGDFRDEAAGSVIYATGRAVAPGFVDPHTHSDFTILQDPYCSSKIRQGVTTEIGGNCGFSLFPSLPERLEAVKSYVSFMPGSLSWSWRRFRDVVSLLETTRTAGNFGSLMGHGMARIMAAGFSSDPIGPERLKRMSELLEESLREGAIGLSLGLAYPPGSFADTEELIALGRAAARFPNALVTAHLRDEGDGVIASVAEILRVARETGIPVHISHHKTTGPANWGKVARTMEMMAEAAAGGLDVTFDVYPYTAGNTTIVSLFPKWCMDKGVKGLMDRLSTERSRIAREADVRAERIGGWDRIVVATVRNAENRACEGRSIAEIARDRGSDGASTLIDLCLEEAGAVNVLLFYIDDEDVKAVMRHPLSMFGSDGKILKTEGPLSAGKPHPRNFGAYPRILAKYVREEKTLTLPEAIRKMTSFPAKKFNLEKRGLLKAGHYADVTVFDPANVRDKATFDAPQQYPEGIDHVIVNGTPVIRDGRMTGALPGKTLLRT